MLFDDCLTDLYNSALNTDYDATKGIYSDLINGIIDECEFEELLEDVINGDYGWWCVTHGRTVPQRH